MFHKFKYYLLDKEGRSYYLDNNGNVQKSATPKPLVQSPDGWQDVNVGFERTLTDYKLGILRSFTLPLAFVRYVSKILKYIAYSLNLEQEVYTLIQRLKAAVNLTALTFSLVYKYLYKGQVDFSSFSDKDVRTSVTLSEGGIAKSLKANEGTVFENSLDDPEAVILKHDGVQLYDTAKFIETPVNVPISGASGNHFVPIAFTTRDNNNAFGFAGFQVFADSFSGAPTDTHYFIGTEAVMGIQLKGTISLKLNGNTPFAWRYYIAIYSNLWGAEIAYLNPNGSSGEIGIGLGTKYTFSFDITLSARRGERFYMYAHFTGNSALPNVTSIDYLDGDFTAFFGSRYQTSYVKCFKLSTLGKRLTKQVTGNKNDLDTTLLEANDNILLNSGDGLRGLTGAVVKTSLADYSEFVHLIAAAGQGIENNKLIYAVYEHFLKTDNPIPLGEVAKLVTTVAKEFRYNTLKIGWPVQNIDDLNGKYSFNNSHTYSLPTSVSEAKELVLMTKYISCCYYQEIMRMNLDGQTTVDNEGDNNIFVYDAVKNRLDIIANIIVDADVDGNYIQTDLTDEQIKILSISFDVSGTTSNNGHFTVKNIVPISTGFKIYVNENIIVETTPSTITATYYTLNRPAYTLAGIPDDLTAYNINLSTKRLFLKHVKWINSICYNLEGQKVKFLTTEKNADLVTTLSGVTITEKGDYEVTDSILFKPFYHEFDVSYDLLEALDSDINSPLVPTWYGDNYKGFLIKAKTSVNDNKAQSFKILAAPDSDLTKLIF